MNSQIDALDLELAAMAFTRYATAPVRCVGDIGTTSDRFREELADMQLVMTRRGLCRCGDAASAGGELT